MKRHLTNKQLNYLAWKRYWTKVRKAAWARMPDKMEAIRKEATAVAKTVKDEKNDKIREAMTTWPSTLDTATLREYILKDFSYSGKVSSLIWRMRRHGMMEFRTDGLWHNLCHLPAALASEDSPDKDEPQPQGDSQRPDRPDQGGQVV
jgi:hypothetical protein